MSSFWHKLGAILGPVAAILPVLGAIPGAGVVVNVAITLVGVATTLVTSLDKAFPPK
jgi:Flp pilus assembly pilin Flp